MRLKPSPLKNMVSQAHNLIRLYGHHTADEICTWKLDYGKLVKIFKSHLVQPKWHKEMYPDADFSHLEYLIRGHPDRKASNPSFAHRILN